MKQSTDTEEPFSHLAAAKSPSGRNRWVVVLVLIAFAAPRIAAAHGSFHERIEHADRAIAEQPLDPNRYLERARYYRTHGDFDEALADVERAASLDPTLAAVHYDRGITLLEAGRAADAEVALSRFLEQAPEHPDARAARARARMQQGRSLDAARDFDVAIAHEPVPLPGRYLDRARAYAAAGDPYLAEAIRGLDAGLAILGAVPALERAAIDLEVRRGDFDAAVARVDRAAAHSPRKESWLARRGDILMQAGRNAQALESYERALAELERLPVQRRRTPLTQQLATKLREEIERLSAPRPE